MRILNLEAGGEKGAAGARQKPILLTFAGIFKFLQRFVGITKVSDRAAVTVPLCTTPPPGLLILFILASFY